MKRNGFVLVLLASLFAVGSISPSYGQNQESSLFNEGAKLYSDAYRLNKDEKNDQVLPLIQRALAIFQQTNGENSSQVADCRNILANIFQDTFKHDAAREQFERVLEIRKKVYGERHEQTCAAWFNLGISFYNLQKYDDALRWYQTALEIGREAAEPRSRSVCRTLLRIAEIHKHTARYSAAVAVYQEALQLARANPEFEPSDAGWVLYYLGRTHNWMMDYPTAIKYFEQAKPIFGKAYGEDSLTYASLLDDLGGAHVGADNLITGRDLEERVLEIIKRIYGPNDPHTSFSYMSLSNLYSKLGDYKAARAAMEKAIAIREATYGPHHPDTAGCYMNLGNLLVGLGEDDAGLKFLEKALLALQRTYGENHLLTVNSQLSLGTSLTHVGKHAEGRTHLEKALAILRASDQTKELELANVLNNLSLNRDLMGEYQEAVKYVREARTIRKKVLGDNHPATLLTTSNLAIHLEANRNSDETISLLNEVRRGTRQYVMQMLPSLSEREQLNFLREYDEKRFQASLCIAWLHRDDPVFAANSAEWLINGKATAQEALATKPLQVRDPSSKSMQELARVRAQLAALSLSVPESGQEAARREELQKLSEEEKKLARETKAAEGNTMEVSWIDLATVQAAIPANAYYVDIISFHLYDLHARGANHKWLKPRYVAWLVPPAGKGKARIVDLGERDVIDQAIQKVRISIDSLDLIRDNGEAEAEKEMREAGLALSQMVLSPLLAAIPPATEKILLSPDRELWLTPWGALPLADGRFAIEKYEFQFFVSGRDLAARKVAVQNTTQPVIVADPDFDLSPQESRTAVQAVLRGAYQGAKDVATRTLDVRSSLPKVDRLPGTAEEARMIGPHLRQLAKIEPVVYSERYAQEAIVKVVQRPKALVLSTHGFFLEDKNVVEIENKLVNNESKRSLADTDGVVRAENPLLRCGLLLAGCNHRSASAGGDDGVLTGLEICGMDLRGTELVVLSACQTGQGQIESGEGVVGLRQAFQLAGAQAVVSSLWQVPDRESALIMNEFVAGLAEGKENSQALCAGLNSGGLRHGVKNMEQHTRSSGRRGR